MKVYQALAQYHNQTYSTNPEHCRIGDEMVKWIQDTYLPSGSGFDDGVTFTNDSKQDRLVLSANFHHMDEHGGYCGWSYHQVIVTPSLANGFDMRITGRDGRGIKEYIAETIGQALNAGIDPNAMHKKIASLI